MSHSKDFNFSLVLGSKGHYPFSEDKRYKRVFLTAYFIVHAVLNQLTYAQAINESHDSIDDKYKSAGMDAPLDLGVSAAGRMRRKFLFFLTLIRAMRFCYVWQIMFLHKQRICTVFFAAKTQIRMESAAKVIEPSFRDSFM